MKKLIVLTIICVFMLSGCSAQGDASKIGSRAIVQAVAVDYNNGYRVNALLFSSGGSGGNTIDASKENVIKVTGEGSTFAEAIDSISLVDGKRIYMCETKLVILGKGFELYSAADMLDTLYYDMRCSLNMPVCCTDSAEAITDLKFTEGITSAEKPLALIENAYEMGVSPKATLLDLLSDLKGGKSTLVPYLEVTKNGSGMTSSDKGETAVISGCREMQKGLLNGNYNLLKTTSLMLWNGLADSITLNYEYNGMERSCKAYRIRLIDNSNGRRSVEISAKFRSLNGGSISDDERKAAIRALAKLLEYAV